MTTRHRYRFAALTAAAAILLAACGGAGDSSSPTLPSLIDTTSNAGEQTTTTVEVDNEEAMLEYTQCMRENGVDMPDPTTGEGGYISIEGGEADFGALEEANKECSPILEAAYGDFELTPEQDAEMRDLELAFAQCMRDNGIDWPDSGAFNNLDEDFDFSTANGAMEICGEEVYGDDFSVGPYSDSEALVGGTP